MPETESDSEKQIEAIELPVLAYNWHLWAAGIIVLYTLLFRLYWDLAAGKEHELYPLEALSRVVPALALLSLFPFLHGSVRSRLARAPRRRLWVVTLGFALFFTQEADWMTALREPSLIGRAVSTLAIGIWWLALFTAFAAGPRDLLPSAPHRCEVWTLLAAMAGLVTSQMLDLVADARIYGFDWAARSLPRAAGPLESMLELLFVVGLLYVTLRWLGRVEPAVTRRLLAAQFWTNALLALIIGLAIGLTQWRHGEPAPLAEAAGGWLVAFGALGYYLRLSRRNGLL